MKRQKQKSSSERRRTNRPSHGRHDYNLLEPRLLLVNYHFGDAPEPYPVTLSEGGARHGTATDSFGSSSDGEHSTYADSKTPSFFTGSICSPGGRVFFSDPTSRQAYGFDWDPNEDYYIDGWVDWNQDGDWNDGNEQIFNSISYYPFDEFQGFDWLGLVDPKVPINAALGGTFGRFRISSTGNLAPTGYAPDGLMDDVYLNVVSPDFENVDAHGFAGLSEPEWGNWAYLQYIEDSGTVLTDFSEDGQTDVASAGYFKTYPGNFIPALGGPLSQGNKVGDINGDDRPDLIEVYNSDETGQHVAVSSLRNYSPEGWAGNISFQFDPLDFGVIDYDGNGRDDLVAETFNDQGQDTGIYWLGGQTDYRLTQPALVNSVFQAAPLQHADIDGNGTIDLISREAVYLRTSGTNFSRIPLAQELATTSELYTSDIDGDGQREVIGISGSNLYIQEYQNGTFNTVHTQTSRYQTEVIVTDLDNDNHLEVILDGTGSTQISVLQFDGVFNPTVQTFNYNDDGLILRLGRCGDVARNWTGEYPTGTDFAGIPIEAQGPTSAHDTVLGILYYSNNSSTENTPPNSRPNL